MKKLLNISVIAALAVLPMAANAAVGEVVNSTEPAHANSATVASAEPGYALATEGANDGNLATAGYVKGAYNATMKAINKVATTAGNAADKDLSNLSGTGKSNVSAQGTVDLTKNDYGVGTVGKALVDIKTTADSAASKDLNNLSVAGTGVITAAVTANAASGTFTSAAGLTSGTLGAAIDEVAGTAGNAADKSLSNINTAGENKIKNLAADGAYDNTTSGLTGDTLQEAIDELAAEKLDASDADVAANGAYISAGTDVAANLTALDNAVDANADAITVLNGDASTTGSVAKQIADAVTGLGMTDYAKRTGVTQTITDSLISGTVPVLTTWNDDTSTDTVDITASITGATYAEPSGQGGGN